MGGTGWLFLFSVLMAAGLLFTMVFFVRPLHPRLLSLPFPSSATTLSRANASRQRPFCKCALSCRPCVLQPSSPPEDLPQRRHSSLRRLPSPFPPTRSTAKDPPRAKSLRIAGHLPFACAPSAICAPARPLISNAHVSPAPATPLNISVTMLGVLSS
ncbi:hypothetical protein C8T65DRAFT_33582 [Cerioporus squamosus]|nr:hypothetical protein C8T65DRAFT_33582 [Cerioporus squamosus]